MVTRAQKLAGGWGLVKTLMNGSMEGTWKRWSVPCSEKTMAKNICSVLVSNSGQQSTSVNNGNVYEILKPMKCKNRRKNIPQRQIITHKIVFT